MKLTIHRLHTRSVFALVTAAAATLAAVPAAHAVSVFNGAIGGISFGVANLGVPANPGAPTYLPNVTNGRNDILNNPGIGLSANPSLINNTFSVGPLAWGPGQFIGAFQNGGGNINGLFGSGAAAITGPQFAYRLSDGGVPGGNAASYEILTWDANFTQVGAAPVGTTGTFVSMAGRVPAAQDVAMVSLRTQLIGPTIGNVELPGLILGVENLGGGVFNTFRVRDGLGGAATPMPGGGAVIIDNAALGTFRGLVFNVLPDLGAIDLLSIPNGEVFTARVTATVYSDPASIELIAPLDPFNIDLLTAAQLDAGGTLFPASPITNIGTNVPEPAALTLVAILVGICSSRRRR